MSDNTQIAVRQPHFPDFLFRFIRPSWLETPGNWFDLRDGPPPEPSVSLYIGVGSTLPNRVCDAVSNCSPKFNIKPTGKAAEINTHQAIKVINIRKAIINFVDDAHPHYGLVYISADERDILRAKSILTVMARNSLAQYDHCETFISRQHAKKDSERKAKSLKS